VPAGTVVLGTGIHLIDLGLEDSHVYGTPLPFAKYSNASDYLKYIYYT
jgi:hypothetical protein